MFGGENDPSYRLLDDVFKDYSYVDICNATSIIKQHNISLSVFPMMWRFLLLLDPTVDNFMSRDSDSHVVGHEVDAVRQLLASNFTFHLMRDNIFHCVEILGGIHYSLFTLKIIKNVI